MRHKVVDARSVARWVKQRPLTDGASDIDRLDEDSAIELEQRYLGRLAGLDRRVELEELRRLAAKIDELVLERPAGLEEREPRPLCERSYAAVPEPGCRHRQAEGERGAGEHLRGCRHKPGQGERGGGEHLLGDRADRSSSCERSL